MPSDPSTPSEPELTLENCEAARVIFQPDENGVLSEIIVWRGRRSRLKLPAGRRVRTLVKGDLVSVEGVEKVVDRVEAWR